MTIHHKEHKFRRGDKWVIHGTLYTVGSTRMNLTGATFAWEVVPQAGGAAVLTQANATIAVVDADEGTLTITVLAATTATVPTGHYVDKLRVTLPGPDGPYTVWEGELQVRA